MFCSAVLFCLGPWLEIWLCIQHSLFCQCKMFLTGDKHLQCIGSKATVLTWNRVNIGVHTLPKEYKCFTFLIHGFCLHMIIYALRNYQTQMYQKNPIPTIFLFSGRCVFGVFLSLFFQVTNWTTFIIWIHITDL